MLLGMFAWLCAPGLMGPLMVVNGAGGVDEGVGEESIRRHPQISKHQPAQEGTSRCITELREAEEPPSNWERSSEEDPGSPRPLSGPRP